MEPIDITTALFRLNNLRNLKAEELQSIDFAIAQLNGVFAPKFAELDALKAENILLKQEK